MSGRSRSCRERPDRCTGPAGRSRDHQLGHDRRGVTLLDPAQRELLDAARRATLVTLAADGRPRPVPIAYAFEDGAQGLIVYSALDEKRKVAADPRELARVRDIGTRPRVAVLVDHWDEDWARLAWVRLEGTATVLEPPDSSDAEHAHAVSLL